MIKIKAEILVLILLLTPCCGSSPDNTPDTNYTIYVDDFTLANSLLTSTTRLDILYNTDFEGDISYIVNTSDLGITTEAEFNASSAAKTEITITDDDRAYNDYIQLAVLSNKKYYVYILIKDSGEVKALTATTKASATSVQETGTVNGATYYINYPAGYNSSSSTTWPFILCVNAPNFTANDPNFPCITFYISGISYSDTTLAALKAKITSIIEDSSYKIDKSRLYTGGFSTGGCYVMMLTKNDGSSGYEFNAVVAIGVNSWITSPIGTLATKNIWLFYGENDTVAGTNSGGTVSTYNSIPKTSGDHFLTEIPAVNHDNSYNPPWQSPYTLRWMLSK